MVLQAGVLLPSDIFLHMFNTVTVSAPFPGDYLVYDDLIMRQMYIYIIVKTVNPTGVHIHPTDDLARKRHLICPG